VERLAFQIKIKEEADLPEIWPEPLSVVVEALRNSINCDQLLVNMPDVLTLRREVGCRGASGMGMDPDYSNVGFDCRDCL
jgi:hypothetical protein